MLVPSSTIPHGFRAHRKKIRLANVTNQLASFKIDSLPSDLSTSAFPAPVQPESLTMPANYGIRPYNENDRSPVLQNSG